MKSLHFKCLNFCSGLWALCRSSVSNSGCHGRTFLVGFDFGRTWNNSGGNSQSSRLIIFQTELYFHKQTNILSISSYTNNHRLRSSSCLLHPFWWDLCCRLYWRHSTYSYYNRTVLSDPLCCFGWGDSSKAGSKIPKIYDNVPRLLKKRFTSKKIFHPLKQTWTSLHQPNCWNRWLPCRKLWKRLQVWTWSF